MTDFNGLADQVAQLADRLDNLSLGDLPLAALQRKLENDWQPDAAVLLQPNSISSDQLQSGLVPLASSLLATMPAVAAGAVNAQTISGLAFDNRIPRLVIAQFAGGGAVYASDQYVIATGNYTTSSFQLLYRSAVAQGAGWTIEINYIAYF